MSTALAIFVKTPGHSPIKTRLAEAIGADAAIAFHRLAARAVAEVAGAVRDEDGARQAYWAVAERAALDDPLWQGLPRVWQGEGALGPRLHHVYAALLAVHERVLLVGADAPQLTPALLRQADAALADPATPFVLGKASDGGFWLFGGGAPVAPEIWCNVRYSQPDTAARLRQALGMQAEGFDALPILTDTDHARDLEALARALAALPAPLPAQRALLCWLEELHARTGGF